MVVSFRRFKPNFILEQIKRWREVHHRRQGHCSDDSVIDGKWQHVTIDSRLLSFQGHGIVLSAHEKSWKRPKNFFQRSKEQTSEQHTWGIRIKVVLFKAPESHHFNHIRRLLSEQTTPGSFNNFYACTLNKPFVFQSYARCMVQKSLQQKSGVKVQLHESTGAITIFFTVYNVFFVGIPSLSRTYVTMSTCI